jgi:putative transposase
MAWGTILPLASCPAFSMDGKGRWKDNVFVERPWRSLKDERIYLHAFETGSELRAGVRRWVDCYNAHRPHSAPGSRTPDEAHAGSVGYQAAAGRGPEPSLAAPQTCPGNGDHLRIAF